MLGTTNVNGCSFGVSPTLNPLSTCVWGRRNERAGMRKECVGGEEGGMSVRGGECEGGEEGRINVRGGGGESGRGVRKGE